MYTRSIQEMIEDKHHYPLVYMVLYFEMNKNNHMKRVNKEIIFSILNHFDLEYLRLPFLHFPITSCEKSAVGQTLPSWQSL